MVVYLDMVMLLNFLVDLLLLLGTNRMAGFPVGFKRCSLAALMGAIYSGGCMLPGFYFLGNGLWRMIILALMASVAFGWNASSLRRGVVFVLLSMALGGVAMHLNSGDFVKLVVSALGVWILCRVGFGGTLGQEYIQVVIRQGDQSLSILALKDTGNTLCDPITGDPVIVIGSDAAERLTGLSCVELASPMDTVINQPGYRLVPYHSVGCPQGMLLGKRYPDVQIGDHRCAAVIAFAPEKINAAGRYQALAGGML